MNKDKILEDFLENIKDRFNVVTFNTWFKDISIYKIDDNKITLLVPMALHKKLFLNDYYSSISDGFEEVTGIKREIDCLFPEEIELENQIKQDIGVDNKEDINSSLYFENNLNRNFTFDNFVVGDSNKFAFTSAKAVASNPGIGFNPLFIYGRSGLGKTHLMHAIGNYILERNPNSKVLYTTSDDFKKDYFNLVISNDVANSSNEFQEKYRNIDVLIIDDIQYLVGAEKTQDEFFHIFNELQSKQKQIIVSSDRSPDDLQKLEERLKSRFSMGLPADIYPPDFELRCRIIKEKIQYLTIKDKMTDEAIEYIANSFDTDVRAIEGAINRLMVYTTMEVPDVIDLAFANEGLKDYVNKNPYNKNDIANIQRAVADYYKLTVEVLKSKKRSANIAYPRMIAMYLSRKLTDESFEKIGMEFGGKDHSTVIHACDKIEEDLKIDTELKDIIKEIRGKL